MASAVYCHKLSLCSLKFSDAIAQRAQSHSAFSRFYHRHLCEFGGLALTDVEIKDRIRQQLIIGVDISSALSTAPGQASRLTYCVTPAHRCAACGDDNPHFEFNAPESKVCLHDRCYWLWRDLETGR